mgnify:CR=1 FL=1
MHSEPLFRMEWWIWHPGNWICSPCSFWQYYATYPIVFPFGCFHNSTSDHHLHHWGRATRRLYDKCWTPKSCSYRIQDYYRDRLFYTSRSILVLCSLLFVHLLLFPKKRIGPHKGIDKPRFAWWWSPTLHQPTTSPSRLCHLPVQVPLHPLYQNQARWTIFLSYRYIVPMLSLIHISEPTRPY